MSNKVFYYTNSFEVLSEYCFDIRFNVIYFTQGNMCIFE